MEEYYADWKIYLFSCLQLYLRLFASMIVCCVKHGPQGRDAIMSIIIHLQLKILKQYAYGAQLCL